MTDQVFAVGIDLGGTKIETALVDGSGEILKKLRLATDANTGPEAVIGKVSGAVRELLQDTDYRPIGVGVGVAGQIDPSGDTVRFAPNLAWHDVPLRAALQRHLNLPVVLLNDVRAATWGEWLYGAGRGCDDLVCLFVGTGIGGGVVSAGRMLSGSSNTAGELGHITVDLHGPPCHCGNRGCLEALAGGWAIARRAREAVAADPQAGAALKEMAHGREDAITAELVARAAHAGDQLAAEIVAATTEGLIAGAVSLVNAFNPGRLILGGGVLDGTPEMARRIERGLRTRALQAACQDLQVIPAKLRNHAGVIGAAAVALKSFG